MGKKLEKQGSRRSKNNLPRVSNAWTPSLSLLHSEVLLTNFEVEGVLRNPYGFLMFVQYSHTLPDKQLSELLLWQDCMMLQHAPKALKHPGLCKIVRKYFTKSTLPHFIACPPDVVPQCDTSDTSDFDLVLPVLKHCLSRLDSTVMPVFRDTVYYSSYTRFVTKAQAPVKFDMFETLRCVGRGGYGRVHAVTKKDTGQMYALKTLLKSEVVRHQMSEFVMREQSMLARLESPFIVNLVYAFQDTGHLYMCMDMMKGGDLKYQLTHHGQMSEDTVRFYAAELICGIQYLHSKGYLHRDIKPQNIMFDQDGHMRITDMGLAEEFIEEQAVPGVSGTVGYMGPEVIQERGASRASDWWSLGVVLFEMAFHTHPFAGYADDMDQRIISGTYHMPSASSELRSLLSAMFVPDPSARLGSRGLADFKEHSFFHGLDWGSIQRREMQAPFTPSEKAHVDGAYDFEDQLAGTEKIIPIKPAEQSIFSRFDFVNPRAFQEEFFRVPRAMQTDVSAV